MSQANILITGASSGIGAALASQYACEGARLILWGRDNARLNAVADICRARGAAVVTKAFDVTDFAVLKSSLTELDHEFPLEMAIFNAGLGGSLPQEAAGQDADLAEAMAGVNFTAPAIGANILASKMASRGHGHIVLVGSTAGFVPLPMAPLYSGSKAGLALFAEALWLRLEPKGVLVSLVSPGFIDTPMSQGLKEPRPFLISAEKAATIITRKLRRRARHIIVPWQFSMLLGLAKILPRSLTRAVLSAF
jgi:Short-chain dehydrogenases of various substrate specificities